jgi:hypothetical protein
MSRDKMQQSGFRHLLCWSVPSLPSSLPRHTGRLLTVMLSAAKHLALLLLGGKIQS